MRFEGRSSTRPGSIASPQRLPHRTSTTCGTPAVPTDEVYQPNDPSGRPDPCDRALDARASPAGDHDRRSCATAAPARCSSCSATFCHGVRRRWRELLGTTKAEVDGALQRGPCRGSRPSTPRPARRDRPPARDLVARYLAAFAADTSTRSSRSRRPPGCNRFGLVFRRRTEGAARTLAIRLTYTQADRRV